MLSYRPGLWRRPEKAGLGFGLGNIVASLVYTQPGLEVLFAALRLFHVLSNWIRIWTYY